MIKYLDKSQTDLTINKQEPNIANLPLYFGREELFNYPNRKTPIHWNTAIEIVFIQWGKVNLVYDGQKTLLKEKEVCIIEAGCVHYFEAIGNDNCSYFIFTVDESLFPSSEIFSRKYLNPLFHHPAPTILIYDANCSSIAEIRQSLHKIITLIIEQKNCYEIFTIGAFNELLAVLYSDKNNTISPTPDANNNGLSAMAKMLDYIHENISKAITVEELCIAGNISRNQCFNVFTEYAGDTPANYILEYKLNMARDYLAATNISISKIANLCGFTHQSHLTNRFTKRFGTTPMQYRLQSNEM